MTHQIEDCSTVSALLVIIAWYAYAIFGSLMLIENNRDTHCYVADDSYEPTATIPDLPNYDGVSDAAESSRYVAAFGLIVLIAQFLLICLAGYQQIIAWLAGLTFVAQLWFFIDLHRARYSHAGKVCFGDYLLELDKYPGSPYLLTEGVFLRVLIISQWLLLSIFTFGLLSSLIVVIMTKVSGTDKDDLESKLDEILDITEDSLPKKKTKEQSN